MDDMSDLRADPIIAHYRYCFERFGLNHLAVQWSSTAAQRARFSVLADAVARDDAVIDVGCGLGDLLDYLRRERGFRGRYLGLDFVTEFVECCAMRFSHDRSAEFMHFDARRDDFPGGYDCFLACGTFNNLVTSTRRHLDWMHCTIVRMYADARKVVAFNVLSTATPHPESALFYVSPRDMKAWCEVNVTRAVTLRADYSCAPATGAAQDQTLYLWKAPPQTYRNNGVAPL